MRAKNCIILILALVFTVSVNLYSQIDISKMTRKEVLALNYDQLLELSLEDLMKLADILGVSVEELYELILNKDVVSASKRVESSFESPLSSSVVSYDDIKAAGARTLEEALRLIPGLIVREKTNGNFDLHIRGNDNLPPHHMFVYSENSITLVMIDNRPVYNYVHGGTFWETLPVDIEDIDRIEVVRGPSSALYGPNAVSGVVNIITRKQDQKPFTVNAHAQYGMQQSITSGFSMGRKLGNKLAIRAAGHYQQFNRPTDLLYVHKANNGKGGLISKEELAILPDYQSGRVNLNTYPGSVDALILPAGDTNYYFSVFNPFNNVDDMYPNPRRSREKMGGNLYLFYDLNSDVHIGLKGGYQSSQVLSTTMGDNPTSLTGRVSNTGYTDLSANIYGFSFQTNILAGWQDIVLQDTGFKVDIFNSNTNLEYDFHFGKLNLRPGLGYQLARYDDLPYLRYKGQGFLNGLKEFNTAAISLRADYEATEQIRLIGALRGEKYSTHSAPYFSYQFIGIYDMNSQHLFRAVLSKANRSPFLVDTYADYYWERDGRPLPGYIHFKGQKDLDLLTMQMAEIGYRVKPGIKTQAEVEIFYTRARNFGALYPDSANTSALNRPWVQMKFRNIELESRQLGLTLSVSHIFSESLVVKAFGTFQQTTLLNTIPYTQDGTVMLMLQSAFFDTINKASNNFVNRRENDVNKATPSFYGGLVVDYKPIPKLGIILNSYGYSGQQFSSKYVADISNPYLIRPKIIVNIKVDYAITKQLTLYLNGRNLLADRQEFAYMDNIGRIILIGLSLNLK